MIEHIFLDMDGTLLNSQGMVSTSNATTIKEANIPISLVSARAPMEMVDTLQKINVNGIHVGFNGGLIYTYENNILETLVEKPLPADEAKYLIRYIQAHFPKISQSYYSRNNWYTCKKDKGISYEMTITKLHATLIDIKAYLHPTFDIFKIMLITFDEAEMRHLKSSLTTLNIDHVSIQQAGQYHLEITHKAAKKSKGIDYILNKKQINPSNTAAFGDGHNDLPMFTKVGYPIAMANAAEDVKLQAKYITRSNDDDGVGYGIKYLLC